MLVGREHERQVIEELLAAARVERSGSLVLVGEAGIGKTALLDAAAAAAAAAGMRMLRATGTESEREVPFGGLLELLRPAMVHLPAIPEPQAQAVRTALALASGPGPQRFAVGAATLSLLSRAAEDRPLAILVDDAHLLDRPSAQAMCFAARRMSADPVAWMFAVRDDAPCAVTEAGLPALPVGGLSWSEAGRLVGLAGRHVRADLLTRLHSTTGGNPLAIIELADDAEAVVAAPPDLPMAVPASLARTFARRTDGLSPATRSALLVAAAAGPDLAVVAAACRALGVSLDDLDAAQAANLVRVDGTAVHFRHGLVRSAVYSEASRADRRSVHAAVAAVLDPDDLDRRAWHLAEAATGPDQATADLLENAAVQARSRGAYSVAAARFERAGWFSVDQEQRADRLVSAAATAWQGGLATWATEMLGRADPLPKPPALRVRVAQVAGAVAARTGSVEQARDLLLAAAAECADEDPDAAVALLADAVLDCLAVGDTATVSSTAAEIDRLTPRSADARTRWVALVATGVAGVLTGDGGPDRIRAAVAQAIDDELLLLDPGLASWLVLGPLFLRETLGGPDLIRTVMAQVRRRTALGELASLLFYLGRDQATTDRWDEAVATYTEGIALAREVGHSTDLAACLAGLAWLEAQRGDGASCRPHAAEARQISMDRSIGFFQAWSVFALGSLDLGLGRPEAALGNFAVLESVLAGLGIVDPDLSPAPETVDALVRLGREDEARAAADRFAVTARQKGQPWSLARAARALGLTCPDAAVDEHFAAALTQHDRTRDTFEAARTRLAYGSRLRRARRRTDARPVLRDALATFDRLGAASWAEQAAAELRATGETAVRRSGSTLGRLTPQELQVARMLAGGRTTREAAAALFLSPKTVEYHLRNVYIKLAIRSRAELAEQMTARPT